MTIILWSYPSMLRDAAGSLLLGGHAAGFWSSEPLCSGLRAALWSSQRLERGRPKLCLLPLKFSEPALGWGINDQSQGTHFSPLEILKSKFLNWPVFFRKDLCAKHRPAALSVRICLMTRLSSQTLGTARDTQWCADLTCDIYIYIHIEREDVLDISWYVPFPALSRSWQRGSPALWSNASRSVSLRELPPRRRTAGFPGCGWWYPVEVDVEAAPGKLPWRGLWGPADGFSTFSWLWFSMVQHLHWDHWATRPALAVLRTWQWLPTWCSRGHASVELLTSLTGFSRCAVAEALGKGKKPPDIGSVDVVMYSSRIIVLYGPYGIILYGIWLLIDMLKTLQPGPKHLLGVLYL